jgi:hypothetical protein
MLWSLAARAGIPAARTALRFLSRMKKPPSGGITVFRGEPLKNVLSKAETAKMYTPTGSRLMDFSNPELRKLAMGRWFTSDPQMASRFAGSSRFLSMFKNPKDVLGWGGGYQPGLVKKITLSAKEAKLSNKLMNKIHGTKDLDYAYVVSKKALKRAETDKLKTFIANFYRMIGKRHGGLAGILEV